MNKLISGEHLVKSFSAGHEKHTILNDVSVEINEGECVAVMGPSGSGKSTLMFALSGMDSVDSGTVTYDGKNISLFKEHELADIRRRNMGFVFQQPTFLKNLNILDNIILPSIRDNRKNVAQITIRARKLMEKMGIAELEKRDMTQVSGGQLQRAGICRALIGNPKIIFGDEPTGALNSTSAEGVMDILADIHAAGTAIMLVTHDAKIAARTERILFMRDGNIVSEMQLQKFKGVNLDDRIKKVTMKMQEIGV